ncbi:MAG TPA: hypothetical protein VK778_03980 [Solirubrobacteraceae bacterium]|nr:hypothetical protein [Solirubrobacteraceae bacterium]
MFPSTARSKLAQRALGAARVARSFLLLEDDSDVDWEVGQDEHGHALHPHRAPLRRGCARRRPGEAPAPPQVCVSPVGRVAPASPQPARSRRVAAGAGRRYT